MSEKFQKDQLVAVWGINPENKHIQIFVREGRDFEGWTVFFCKEPGERDSNAVPWYHCAPLEEADPSAFRSRDMNRVDSLQEDRERQQKQIRWLCQELSEHTKGVLDCPYTVEIDEAYRCRAESCSDCWEQASLKAVKEEADGAE